jgi:hypothetical protein
VQKLDQLVGAAANLLDRRCLRDCVEMFAHVVGTAARWVTMVSNSRKFARPPTWLVLEVEVAEGLSVIVAGNEAGARCFLRSTSAEGMGDDSTQPLCVGAGRRHVGGGPLIKAARARRWNLYSLGHIMVLNNGGVPICL